ncbi:L,D-transpeptidase [Chelativorans salis]|uniref:L,D-transpeptidase n=1 Tax=Chelativorans salis TaxID=2978478 RepID=A0ABT2LHA1_9HYPH|nr:L,D-transpeptidase [Chelativorans sp. EGI FJ00035]MCT7373916.1 L,D-transpeptidase [Chelativorans sp. EGI FJ00035]
MKSFLSAAGAIILLLFPLGAQAQNRYVEPPPVLVSPDLSAPWVLQLRQRPPVPRQRQVRPRREQWRAVERPAERRPIAQYRNAQRQAPRAESQLRTAAVAPKPRSLSDLNLDPKFLPQEVAYDGPHKPGTLVVDTNERFLYHVLEGGKARRYGVGVGKPGFDWAGTHKVTQKREWPDWRPPVEMIAREKKKGRILPVHMKGGERNPLGARALYLGSTLYRIHGTNAPWTIGQAVSSGCIRMRNEDVIELYERVPVGAKVVVI